MVIIEVKDESATFLCTDCDRTISTGRNFLVKRKDLPKSRISRTGNRIYYTCVCGSRSELIKSSNPLIKDQMKFKHVKVVEMGYAF
jgi:hypothetical protein